MWPLLGPLLGAAIPAVASAFGQHKANQANVRLSREGMAFEGDQVAKQMAFQERMSNSSYQRATEDMRLAGINPMLAYAQGGASTPGGGAASGAAATVQDVVGPAVASAQHARRMKAELDLMAEQRQATNAGRLRDLSQMDVNDATVGRVAAETRNIDAQTLLHSADLPSRLVSGQVGGGRFGKVTEYIRRGLGTLNPALGAAAGLFGGRLMGALRYRSSGGNAGGVRESVFRGGKGSSTGAGSDYYDLWRNTYTR